jgi:hypothetical protein
MNNNKYIYATYPKSAMLVAEKPAPQAPMIDESPIIVARPR